MPSQLVIWTFGTLEFYPISAEHVQPRWKRQARINVNNLVGTGLAEFNQFGHTEYRLQCEAYVPSLTDMQQFEALQGTSATFVGYDSSYTAVVLMNVEVRRRLSDYIEVSLEFARTGTS